MTEWSGTELPHPIVAGFFPDPTVCRIGDEYLLAHSSFEYFPGVPLWRSSDLMTWSLIGNILDRPNQLNFPPMATWITGGQMSGQGTPVPPGSPSTGIYAPTLRTREGVLWMTTTNVNLYARGPLIVHAERPEGPWSEPVYVTGLRGIDSDLAWDDSGTCWMTLSSYDGGRPTIVSAPIDPFTGTLLAAPIPLWSGTGGSAPEAPHLFRRKGWWYLLLAEGGTGPGHSVVVARATDLEGPWEGCPENPILTHRGTDHPVQATGHADLVMKADGEWAMVFLGTRPRAGFHVNGRETFLAGVDWVDDWPVVDEGRYLVSGADHSFSDAFERDELHPRWISPGGPVTDRLSRRGGMLTLTRQPDAERLAPILAARARDQLWSAELDVDLSEGAGSLLLRIDATHEVAAVADHATVSSRIRVGTLETALTHTRTDPGAPITLVIRTVPTDAPTLQQGPDVVEIGYLQDGNAVVIDRIDGRYLSSEVAGGFTGRVIGIRADRGEVGIRGFRYRAGDD